MLANKGSVYSRERVDFSGNTKMIRCGFSSQSTKNLVDETKKNHNIIVDKLYY